MGAEPGVMEELQQREVMTGWWAILLRGLLAIIFGVLTMVVPGITLAALILFFAVYAAVEGVVNIVGAVRARPGAQRWWVLVLEGVVSIGAAVAAVVWPGITALALVYVIAAWALITGVLEISAAMRLRKQIKGEWLLGLSGVLSIALGVLLVLHPGVGALAMVLWIGAYAIVFGLLMVFLAVRLRIKAPPLGAAPLGGDRQAAH